MPDAWVPDLTGWVEPLTSKLGGGTLLAGASWVWLIRSVFFNEFFQVGEALGILTRFFRRFDT